MDHGSSISASDGFFKSFMPHGHCYAWQPDILWTTVISDGLIVLAYLMIPVALLILVKKHPELRLNGVLILFSVFILGCGLTHAVSIWNIWHGDYGFQALMKATTAVASVLTAVAVWRLLPLATRIHGPAGLHAKLAEFEDRYDQERSRLKGSNSQLTRQVTELNDELRARNAVIEQANRDLETRATKLAQSNDELRQFAYVASHDLQAPLRNIAGFVQLLSRRYGEKLDDSARELIRRTVASTEQMRTLIQELLRFSRIETQGDVFETVELDGVIAQTREVLESVIDEHHVTFEVDALPRVNADRGQLLQLFTNLVGNAVKYNDSDESRVKISCSDAGAHWRVSVADNGIGIDVKHHEKIFEVFRRLHTQEAYPGTGIGLAVCQRVARRHGGYITVESEPGNGSTFNIHLPKSESANEAA